jgi:glycosyltransferase involved in cell wall biosynthesis
VSTLTNLQPLESYIAESYTASKNHLRELWFMCHSRGFSYAVFDGYDKALLKYHSYEVADFFIISPATLQEFLDAIDVFLSDFKNIKIVFENPNYTLTPAALFDEEETENYYKLKYTLGDGEQLLNQRIPDFGAQVIYAVPEFMLNLVVAKFTESSVRDRIKIFHHIHILLSALYYQTSHLNREVCYVNLSGKTFDIVLVRNSALIFCNTYTYNNPEDVLYFVMHLYQSHKLNPETDECMVSGENTDKAAIRELLYTYIKNVTPVTLSPIQQTLQPSSIFLLQHCV